AADQRLQAQCALCFQCGDELAEEWWFGTPADAAAAVSVAQNADTRLELFRIGPNGDVWHSWQVAPNADWSAWTPMTNPEGAAGLLIVHNADGRLELFL